MTPTVVLVVVAVIECFLCHPCRCRCCCTIAANVTVPLSLFQLLRVVSCQDRAQVNAPELRNMKEYAVNQNQKRTVCLHGSEGSCSRIRKKSVTPP